MGVNEHDPQLMNSIAGLFHIASNDHAGDVNMSPVEVRIRAALALAVFLPHPQARRKLIDLMASSTVPKEVRNVASEALNGGANVD